MKTTIGLASASPRRHELLSLLQQPFEHVSIDVDEQLLPAEPAVDYVQRLARTKAEAGFKAIGGSMPVLGADTIVVIENQVLGKPADEADFTAMMQRLSGKIHQVHTAVAIACQGRLLEQLVTSRVHFASLSEQMIADYWQSGEPADKAGGYGIQGIGGRFVRYLEGSYSAVVGLPLYETDQLLQQLEVVT
ncbi:Maf family protein [Alkalimonas sp. MEB108]|uniref:dTTP/UTP pyrophosphatase n=1 Tax=Alkalimonas cellulosilytica TaxID=3058395 RepID=A0ABU7J2S9_9GAMM|nr:Maf family protein [Alkalimonas sp. MEB108]MEE2000732.1 Maf family protein [Alkalimonas sp. MEB108]